MASKIKNIIIFTVIAALLILAYILFFKPTASQQNLVSSSSTSATGTALPDANTLSQNSVIAQNFLAVLLSVRSIKLDDSIFSDPAFTNLHDSSISLASPGPGDEGRLNPFAPIGSDAIQPITCALPQVLNTATNTCITPIQIPTCTLPKVLNTTTNTCITPPAACVLPKVLNTTTNTCVTPTP